jgi:hypothetical protein
LSHTTTKKIRSGHLVQIYIHLLVKQHALIKIKYTHKNRFVWSGSIYSNASPYPIYLYLSPFSTTVLVIIQLEHIQKAPKNSSSKYLSGSSKKHGINLTLLLQQSTKSRSNNIFYWYTWEFESTIFACVYWKVY